MLSAIAGYDNANEVVPGIWLGNKLAAKDGQFLKDAGITTVFNCTKDLPFHDSIKKRYRIPVDDNLDPKEIENMYLWAPEAIVAMVREYKKGERILVHCHAGMQRSAALLTMALMAMMHLPSREVIPLVRKKRPIAFWTGVNFQPAIDRFERDFFRAAGGL